VAETDARLAVQTSVVADLDRRIGQIDAAIEEATRRGRANGAMTLAEEQRKLRSESAASRQWEAQVLAGIEVEKAEVETQRAVRLLTAGAGARARPDGCRTAAGGYVKRPRRRATTALGILCRYEPLCCAAGGDRSTRVTGSTPGRPEGVAMCQFLT
jgi:hypothetical protein